VVASLQSKSLDLLYVLTERLAAGMLRCLGQQSWLFAIDSLRLQWGTNFRRLPWLRVAALASRPRWTPARTPHAQDREGWPEAGRVSRQFPIGPTR